MYIYMYMYVYVCCIVCTGDNNTVVYLEEVPIQSLPDIKGIHHQH